MNKNELIQKGKFLFIKLKTMGLHNILGASFVNKLVMMLYNVIIVRILTKSDYGIFTSCWNTVSLVAIFSGLGLNEVLLQFSSEAKTDNERNSIVKFVMTVGSLSSFVCAVGLIFYAVLVVQKIPETRYPLAALSMVLVPLFLQLMTVAFFRSTLENKKYAITTNANSILFVSCSVLGAYFFGLYGIIAGKYIGFTVSFLVGLFLMRNSLKIIKTAKYPNNDVKKHMIKYGLTITLTNAVGQLLYLLDVYVIGLVTGSSTSIASYKTATIIPFALNFLPGLVVTFIYPYFAKNRENTVWIQRQYRRILVCLGTFNAVISAIGIIFAPFIITTFFGSQYADSVAPFRVLMVSFFFAGTFRVISGNILAMLRKVNINLYLGIVSCVLNIVLDYVLILKYQSIGAAYATLAITAISGIMSTVYLQVHLKKKIKYNQL